MNEFGPQENLRLKCEVFNCGNEAVAHHEASCTNLCEACFNRNERQVFCIAFPRSKLKRTYKSKDYTP